MTNAFSSMGYPHWLMLAGTVLLVLGFVGMALRQRAAQAGFNEITTGDEGPSESETESAETQVANRQAKLEQRKRDRWADKDRSTEEILNARPKISDKETN